MFATAAKLLSTCYRALDPSAAADERAATWERNLHPSCALGHRAGLCSSLRQAGDISVLRFLL